MFPSIHPFFLPFTSLWGLCCDTLVARSRYYTLNVQRRFLSSLLLEGQLAVDTFFFLSGYLGMYVSLRKYRLRARIRS